MTRLKLPSSLLFAVCIGLFASSALAIGRGTMAPELGLAAPGAAASGPKLKIADLRGKVVLVDFWASWCAPCKQELPVLEGLYKKYKSRGFEIVAVSVDKDAANITKFLRATPVSFRVVHDAGGAVAGRYAPPKMPSSYLVDRKGLIRYVHEGFKASDEKAFDKEIQELLGAK